LKRAYLAGFPNARYMLRGQSYVIDFAKLTQKNEGTGKPRDIRPPHKFKQPPAPIVKKGQTFVVKVPPGGPGSIIQVPHPKLKGQMVAVNVPATAKVGQAMLVPIPQGPPAALSVVEPSAAEAAAVEALPEAEKKKRKAGWSTGAKVAAGTAGIAVVGGLAVGGAVLGEHIAEEGWDATMAELGGMAVEAGEAAADGATTAGEGIADAAEPAGEWVAGAATDAADAIMDLL